jgi:hypothetical protein
MTIVLEPETEARLRETAQRGGWDVNALANALLAEALEQKDSEFVETVAALQVGLEAVKEGRERPFEEFLAEHKARYRSDSGHQVK